MISAESIEKDVFVCNIDTNIYSKKVIAKTIYWYASDFIIFWEETDINISQIKFQLKDTASRRWSFNELKLQLNQDLIDNLNREIIFIETKNIRDILYVKAFSNNDDFEDFNLI